MSVIKDLFYSVKKNFLFFIIIFITIDITGYFLIKNNNFTKTTIYSRPVIIGNTSAFENTRGMFNEVFYNLTSKIILDYNLNKNSE